MENRKNKGGRGSTPLDHQNATHNGYRSANKKPLTSPPKSSPFSLVREDELGNITRTDTEILNYLNRHDGVTQADLIRSLLPLSGEAYLHSRIKTLAARGLVLKERRDGTNTRYLSLTPAGRATSEAVYG